MRTLALSLVCAVLASGCALLNGGPRPDTIGALMSGHSGEKQALPPVVRHKKPLTARRSGQLRREAISNYRKSLATVTAPKERAQIMRRLATLKLDEQRNQQANGASPGTAASRDAIRLYKKALALQPNAGSNDKTLYSLARAYHASGDEARAARTLGRLVRRYPNSRLVPEAHFRRGEFFFAHKRFDAAAQSFRAVLQNRSTQALLSGHISAGRFHNQSLYMLGWSLYEGSHYQAAVGSFIRLLDRVLPASAAGSTNVALSSMPAARKTLVRSTLRGTSLSFSSMHGNKPINAYFANRQNKRYEPLLYADLTRFYERKERYSDAVQTDYNFVESHPLSPLAPHFERQAIAVYKKGGFPDQTVRARARFVHDFAPGAPYWKHHKRAQHPRLEAEVKADTLQVAKYYNAKGQSAKSLQARIHYSGIAATWYRRFLADYPHARQATKLRYQMADTLLRSQQYDSAASAFYSVAYDHPKPGRHGADAAYALFLARLRAGEAASGADAKHKKRLAVGAALQLAKRYPHQKGTLPALTRSAQLLYSIHDYNNAAMIGARVLQAHPQADARTRRAAAIVVAQANFERGDFHDATRAYRTAIRLPAPPQAPHQPGHPQTPDVTVTQLKHRLTISLYKQGNRARGNGDLNDAVQDYLKASQSTKNPDIRQKALYDAAASLIASQEWPQAVQVLEALQKRYPHGKLHAPAQRKLAVAYQKNSQPEKAAVAFTRIAHRQDGKTVIRREAARQAFQLYAKAGDTEDALQAGSYYIAHFPTPLEPAEDTRAKLANLNARQGDTRTADRWRKAVIEANKSAGQAGTDHTRYLAAHAALALANVRMQAFQALHLRIPLKRSLKKKKKAMQAALKAYGAANGYNVSDVTTAATYHIAQIYQDFSQDIRHSQRPRGLSGLELKQYNVMLEEQADPFEQKAVNIYETNAQRVQAGVYNKWVKRSIHRLAKLYPARYDKTEKGERVIDASR